jgi:hypothetical protein
LRIRDDCCNTESRSLDVSWDGLARNASSSLYYKRINLNTALFGHSHIVAQVLTRNVLFDHEVID